MQVKYEFARPIAATSKPACFKAPGSRAMPIARGASPMIRARIAASAPARFDYGHSAIA